MDTVVDQFYSPLNSTRGNGTILDGNPWIAFHDFSTIASRCGGSTPLHLFYAPYVTLLAQKLGASAVVVAGGKDVQALTVPPDVDVNAGTVLGEEITIPVFIAVWTDNPKVD